MHVYRYGRKILLISWDLLLSNRYHFQFSKISQRSHFFITISQQSLLHSLFKFGYSNHALVNHGLFFFALLYLEEVRGTTTKMLLHNFTPLYIIVLIIWVKFSA